MALAAKTSLVLIEYSYKIPEKFLQKQVDKFDILTNKNIEMTRLFKKNIVTLKEFITPNKVVTPEEISNNI